MKMLKNKMRPELLTRLMKSRYFLKSFFLIMGIMTVVFLLFSLFTYQKSRSILENEFTASGQYRLEVTAKSLDNYLMDIRYIAATLDTNKMVQAFFAFEQPNLIYDDFYGKVQENLKAYVNGYSSIDSIYLYSQCADSILTATDRSTTSYFSDMDWMDHFVEEPDGFRIFFRAKNNAYPFVLCVMKQLKVNGYDAAIVINLNLDKISHLTEISDAPYQEIFLISDEAQILYRNRQRDLAEPLDIVPELINFREGTDSLSTLVAGGDDPYTYTQIHSKDYPWSYVMVTHLQEYTNRLSSSRAVLTALFFALFFASVLFAFLFSLRSVRPIQNLLTLLQNPQETLSKELYSDKEICYIADQITSYIQQNQTLSDELTSRLNLLNETKLLALQSQINPHFLFNTLNMIHILESEALGYGHKIPRITLNLSKLLRYAIESTDLVSLDTELKFTKMYISILQERYGNKLHVIYDIEKDTLGARVPKLFIQPIIENAIFHGLAENMDENSTLTLSCRLDHDNSHDGNICGDGSIAEAETSCRTGGVPGSGTGRGDALSGGKPSCIVEVRDNGVGMPPETLEQLRRVLEEQNGLKGSIGLKNIATRMNLLYGEEFSFSIDSEEGTGSAFTLRFPFIS